MLEYVVAGLVSGAIYALAASCLAITYEATGILNFAFAAMAFTVARFYYFLNSGHGWPTYAAALVAILGLGPVLGAALYLTLFRRLRLASSLVRVIVMIGLAVALPAVDNLIFGNATVPNAPGLAPQPVHIFNVIGVPISLDDIIVLACAFVLVAGSFAVLRFTQAGLQIRALVDSPAMTSLSGVNASALSLGVWIFSTVVAGLVGVLVAPQVGLTINSMSVLMTTAFAAVIAAKLRRFPVAVLVGLAMGIVTALIQYYLPSGSGLTGDLIGAIPFIVILVSVLAFTITSSSLDENEGVGGALDRAIRSQATQSAVSKTVRKAMGERMSLGPAAFGLLCLLGLPLLLHGSWLGLLAAGVAYGMIFLSYTLVTGDGGMIWLCQPTFAGGGAFAAALLASHGVPVLLAILLGALLMIPVGIIVGLVTIGMGDLYVALITLTFGLLIENTVFSQQRFQNQGTGILINPPTWASGSISLAYLAIGLFIVLAVIIANFRDSTPGLAAGAVRSSPTAARTLGISVMSVKVLLAGAGAFVAAIGGGFLAVTLNTAIPSNYTTLAGEVWLAVLVTQGIRSNSAALAGGLSQTLAAGVVVAYLSPTLGNVIPALFGLGAIAVLAYPEGVLTMQARQLRALLLSLREVKPAAYRYLKFLFAAYFVVLVVLLRTEGSLWWECLVVTLVLQNLLVLYLTRATKRIDEPHLVVSEISADQSQKGSAMTR